jgi:hypothetical protein
VTALSRLASALGGEVRVVVRGHYVAAMCLGCEGRGSDEDAARAALLPLLRQLAALHADRAERDAATHRRRAGTADAKARALRSALEVDP